MLLITATHVLLAQSASLSGRVTDSSAAVVSDADVTLTNEATRTQQRTTSNGEGLYSFAFLQSGAYKLTIKASGFKLLERPALLISTGQNATLDVALELGDVSQTVTVEESGLQINTVDASVSTLIDRKFVENLPMNGRTLQSLMTMVPGVAVVPTTGNGYSGEITVNGQRTESNYFTVDGVSANVNTGTTANPPYGAGYSGSTGSATALGTTQSMVSLDALQEFRASTSTYSAEYGRTPGGQFAFTTRSGTNQFHGSLFNYFRNDVLDANDFFSNRTGVSRQQKRQNDFGGTFAGPLSIPHLYNGRARTFFFFSYEGLRLRAPQAGTTIDVPSVWLRQNAPVALRPFLNAWPVPNGADIGNGLAWFTGAYSNPGSLNATSIRIDHALSDAFKVFGRYNVSPSSSGSRVAANPANAQTADISLQSLTLGATALVNARLTNDTRFNYTFTDSTQDYSIDNYGGATPLDLSPYPGIGVPNAYLRFGVDFGTQRGVFFLPRSTVQKQFNITDTAVAVLGKHTLKFGIDYRRLSNNVRYPLYHLRPSYTSLAAVMANQPNSFAVYKSSGLPIRPVYVNFSAFVQDEWRATRRLSLSLGLRWDVNPAPSDADGNNPYTVTSTNLATLQAAPRGTALWQTRWGGFAPRFGVAYQAGQKAGRETVVRAGVGLFYDLGTTQASTGYDGLGGSTLANLAGTAFPLSQATLDAIPAPSAAAPYGNTVFAFDPNLNLPRTWQWNFAVEQALGSGQTLTAAYLGSAGRQLLIQRGYYPGRLGNTNFASNGQLLLTVNGATSDYHALQLQYQRRLSRGLQVSAAYTWSHALDDASSNFTVTKLLRASADFDLRHNAQVAWTYEVPGRYQSRLLRGLLSDWAMDGRISSRSALPVDVLTATVIDPGTGLQIAYQPNLIPNQPLYIDEPNAPGGRRINFAAFAAAPSGVQGNAGRNLARAFGATQFDLSVRRQFALGEKVHLQLRGEAFNVLNQSIFGAIYNQLALGASRFGYAYTTQNTQWRGVNALHQVGGPRSIQLALKLQF